MIKILKCREVMPGCEFVARALCDEALLAEAVTHARVAHGVRRSPELADQVRAAIKIE